MKFFAYTIDLKDDLSRIEEYLEYHRNSREDVIKAVAQTGIIDEKIWISENHLFMIVIAKDNWDPKDLSKYAQTQAGQEWDSLMRTYQKCVPEAKDGEWWSEMDMVVDLDYELKKFKLR